MFSFNTDRVDQLFNDHPKVQLEDLCTEKEMEICEREFFWDVATMNTCYARNGWFELSCLCKQE